MLTYLELENFRAFSNRIRIDIRPITVLIGRNSSGKSSVLKFLQMVRQTVERSEGDFFETEGAHVHLGAWADLRNRKSGKHYFKCELGYEGMKSPLMGSVKNTGEGTAWSLKFDGGKATLSDEGGKQALVFADMPKLTYRIAANRFYRAGGRRGQFLLSACNADEQEKKPEYEVRLGNISGSRFLQPKATASTPDEVLRNIGADMTYVLPVRNWFSAMRHLAATRSEPERTIQVGTPPSDDIGHRGEYMAAHLAKIVEKNPKARAFIAKHLAEVLSVENLHCKDTVKGWLTRFEARNKETQATHMLADFGFGVSQCLPILVQGAMMSRGEMLTVEQPESQIHPTAQLKLGSFFADLWRDRGVSSLIETHSGNILLRLRKHVRAGDLKHGDVSVAYFHVEDGVTKVTNMLVKPDGELDGHLPMEFFGADLFEALEFNAIPRPEDS